MRLTQGTFSYLPDFTDDDIKGQVRYATERVVGVGGVHRRPPPRNVYWEMWGLPLFELEDPQQVVDEVHKCREAFPNHYIRVNFYDPRYFRQTTAVSFIVNRPPDEPGFRLERSDVKDRRIQYKVHPYAADRPHGRRYEGDGGT